MSGPLPAIWWAASLVSHVWRAITSTQASTVEAGGGFDQRVFTHLALDSYEDNLLLSYAPPGVGRSPNIAAAREEMSQSRYDTDR
ncbi:MAG: hypothetical protein ABJC39_07370, partial [Chloroflexota bacterium]